MCGEPVYRRASSVSMAMKMEADVKEANFIADSIMIDEMAHSIFCNWVTRPIKFAAALIVLRVLKSL